MSEAVPRETLQKIRKLAQLPQEARRRQFAVSVTRLTVLKSLCRQPDVANRFVTFLARKTLERVEQGKHRSSRPRGATDLAHREMMSEALAGMQAWQRRPSEKLRQELRDLLRRMRAEQNEYKNIPWGAARIIRDWELLLFEHALQCLLRSPHEAGHWAYQMARDYAERYDPSHGTGLTPASAPLVQDIADFWMEEFHLNAEAITAPAKTRKPKEKKSSAKPGKQKARFTHRQGQFLAFIHLYRKLHRQGPAELDMVRYFRVTPPSVHDMVVRLEQLGLVTREPGVSRSVRVAIPEKQIPPLENVAGPPS
jgi:DNA-binding MarR family transcriptional regulator